MSNVMTILFCESCGACVDESRVSEFDDITREGAKCCDAETFVAVGTFVDNAEEEESLKAVIAKWEKDHGK